MSGPHLVKVFQTYKVHCWLWTCWFTVNTSEDATASKVKETKKAFDREVLGHCPQTCKMKTVGGDFKTSLIVKNHLTANATTPLIVSTAHFLVSAYVHEDFKRAWHIVCTNNSQASHKKCLLLWVVFLHIVQYLCILKRTKCKDVVLQSVQKFRCLESFVWCLDYKLNLLGASCLTTHMRRHLHVPLGLRSNSGGNMELRFVKIPKHASRTLRLAFLRGKWREVCSKTKTRNRIKSHKALHLYPFWQ